MSDNTSTGTVKSYGYATGGIRGRLISYNGKSLTSYTAKPYSDTGYPQVYFKHGSSDYWKLQWNGSSLKSMQLCNSVGTEKTDKIEYLYNGGGARVRKTVNGIHTDYIYVGSRLLREVKDEYSIDYVYGAEGAIGFEITRSNGVTSRYYYLKNIQGDITYIVDNNGGVVVKYEYDAWGNCKVHDPNGTENGDEDFIGNINPIRYRGYYYDVETKLYYLMSRYYDPEIGRFISPDSAEYIEPEILGGLNLYSYCYNNPIMYIDDEGYKGQKNNFKPRKDPKKGASGRQPTNARERNVGHPNGEEHSRRAKGNRGVKGNRIQFPEIANISRSFYMPYLNGIDDLTIRSDIFSREFNLPYIDIDVSQTVAIIVAAGIVVLLIMFIPSFGLVFV